MVNVELLDETLAYIEEHPENWDQEVWAEKNPDKPYVEDSVCGTAMCFAGRTAALSGWVPVFYGDDEGTVYCAPIEVAKELNFDMTNAHPRQYAFIENRARELLGLSLEDADTLFNGDNKLSTLQDYVSQLKQHGTIVTYHDYED